MTTANKISIARVLVVPFFVIQVLYYVDAGLEYHRFAAVLLFGAAVLSDGVDGYIARRYNQRSELGAILDPLADKLLLIAGIVLLSLDNQPYLPRLPLWFTATVLSRDVVLLIGLAVIQHTCGKVRVRPIVLGKIATVLQMTALLWGLLKWPMNGLMMWAVLATVFTFVSGIFYVLDGIRQLSASPKSTATPQQGL